jgi:hypothetical protein
MDRRSNQVEHGSMWRDGGDISALCDDVRHLGHLVHVDVWHAFDATHLNEEQDGFKYVGGFEDRDDAKRAVENSIAARRPMVMHAGFGQGFLH